MLPDLLFGLGGVVPFVQLVAFRPQILAVAAALAVVLLAAAVRRRYARPFAAGLLAIVLVAGWMVLPRAVADPSPAAAGRPLTVLTLNTYEGDADVAAVAAVIRSERPDLVSLVEAGAAYHSRLAPLVEPLGYRLTSTTGPERADVWGITVAVTGRLGAVGTRVDTTTPFPMIEVSGGGLGALRFVGFHSMAPTEPHELPEWTRDLEQVKRWCSGSTPAVVTGDFNATLDHSLLRSVIAGCDDATAARGQGLVATWPAWVPRWLGAQIDHVFVTEGIGVVSAAVRDVPGTDHRAILTRLVLPAAG
ncbi:endonuclease/exonuclease/phosphatase (EEP) superfamily protein YafD [Pseudonocardia kunmingensis]|uniref:Endonuclease/exonuclease/phosphatase (EEP) superfamily protein YafD n=2 Tax=Pseudonocardia kunmingensis TaxID=630975 RepID=A0A543DKM4_9PSEU|nr:endonuclease/exonuclease/phosphatase (EEP) superfamily protein YafD [Pseudonocardia kunmingensis]